MDQFGEPVSRRTRAAGARGRAGLPGGTFKNLLTGEKEWRLNGGNIKDENIDRTSNQVGTLSMANTGAPDSGGSQFFVNVANNQQLDWFSAGQSKHPVFGALVDKKSVELAVAISRVRTAQDNPVKPVKMERITVDQRAGRALISPGARARAKAKSRALTARPRACPWDRAPAIGGDLPRVRSARARAARGRAGADRESRNHAAVGGRSSRGLDTSARPARGMRARARRLVRARSAGAGRWIAARARARADRVVHLDEREEEPDDAQIEHEAPDDEVGARGLDHARGRLDPGGAAAGVVVNHRPSSHHARRDLKSAEPGRQRSLPGSTERRRPFWALDRCWTSCAGAAPIGVCWARVWFEFGGVRSHAGQLW